MSLLRRVVVIALLPLMAWTGMPQVACRCSSGEVKLFCPRLFAAMLDVPASDVNVSLGVSCCTQPAAASCGKKSASGCCCSAAKKTQESNETSCCATGCRCTPVVVSAGNQVTKEKAEKISLPSQIEFAVQTVSVAYLPRTIHVDVSIVDTGPPPQHDLIVLFERFLI